MTEQQGSAQEPQGTPHEGAGPVDQPGPAGQSGQAGPAGQPSQPDQSGQPSPGQPAWHQPEPTPWPPQQQPWSQRSGVDAARLLLILAALLGITNLFLGFTTIANGGLDESLSFFDGVAFAWLPALLFLGGLLAARAAFVPAARRSAAVPLLVTAATVIPFIFSVIKTDWGGNFPIGATLYLIFGSLQLAATAAAALVNGLQSGRIVVTKVPRRPDQS